MFHLSPHRGRRLAARAGAILAAALLTTVASAGLASAHVHVSGADAVQGGYTMLTFRVPTESDTASTVKVTITMPKDTPIVYAATQPMPGWTAKVTTAKLTTPVKTDDGQVDTYVSQVTWTANNAGDGIKPGEFQMFNLSAGPMPDLAQVSFPALQTYSDGTTVNWNQQSTGSAEPEHPAPVLALAPAASEATHASSASMAPSVSASAMPMDMSGSGSGSGSTSGIVGIVLGAVALVLGAIALLRTRQMRSPSA